MTEIEALKARLRTAPLRIGISTRALFDLEEEHSVFEAKGILAYTRLQLDREGELLRKGTAFEVVDRLLKLNEPDRDPYVQIVVLSRNSPDLSLRAFKSIEHHRLPVVTGSFTSGAPIGPYIPAWDIDLFLSNNDDDVKSAIEAKCAAARLGKVPEKVQFKSNDEVRIAFDGDAVVFSEESDRIYEEKGLKAFWAHEQENAHKPMEGGPFGQFLKKLSKLREIYMGADGVSKVRICIVTARDSAAHARVIRTLRAWGTPADEAHFVGRWPKAPILEAFGAHIFFDDQEKHFLGASEVVPAGHVPGPHAPGKPVIPAG